MSAFAGVHQSPNAILPHDLLVPLEKVQEGPGHVHSQWTLTPEENITGFIIATVLIHQQRNNKYLLLWSLLKCFMQINLFLLASFSYL